MPVITKEVQAKLEQSIINKLVGQKSPLPDFIARVLSERLDLPAIINKVRDAIPAPQNGKDAIVSDEMLSDIVVRVLERTQELIQVKDGQDGPKGENGDQGIKGELGDRGIQGLKGSPGEDGRDGRPGVNGSIGIQGERGKQGIQGLLGKPGKKGESGSTGEPGIDGKDFIISEKDFQSVVDQIDFTEFVPKKELDKVLKKLKLDIGRGRVKMPFVGGGGMTPTQIVKAINDLLDTEDWQNGLPGDGTIPANLSYVQFTTGLSAPSHSEGLLFYDNNNKTLGFYNDESDSTLQIGQELWLRGKNNTGVTITNGQLVYINGNDSGLPTFHLANANAAASAIATIAFATHDIEDGTIGLATKTGTIRDINTFGMLAGALLWLDTTDGEYTTTMPISPNYNVFVGNVGVVDAVNGTIEANINAGGNTGEVIKIFNGAILEDHSINVSSNGSIVTLTLEKNGGGDLSLFFDGVFFVFDTTPAASVTLTAGSDSAPTLNFVYIPNSTKTLTANTSGFPTAEQFVPVAEIMVQSAAGLQSDGCYKCHAWTDHLADSIGQGHLSHVNNWIRHQPATWLSGVDPSTSITVNGGAIDNVYYSNNSGNILQLHEHTFPALDMETGDPIFMFNDPNTAYRRTTDLSTADETSLGVTLRSNNTYYSIVVWGVINEAGIDSKIYGNLPSGSYANSVDAITDPLGFTNTTIPTEYTGTGFLIARVILRYQTVASGTITEILTESLRGTGIGGGGGATGGTEFSDNLFRILNVLDDSKEIDFDASGISPGNIRTMIMPDHDVDLGNVSDSAVKSIRTEINDYTIVATDHTVLADALSNTVDISLPATPNQGQIFNIFCTDSTFTCTVLRNGNNINGAASDQALLATESLTVQYDTTYGWVVL